jgi:uncharacterized protein YjiS (DUF1127 family)
MLLTHLTRNLWHTINEWQEIARQRRAIRHLSDEILKDIGLSRSDADREASRPFWDSSPKPDLTLRARGSSTGRVKTRECRHVCCA